MDTCPFATQGGKQLAIEYLDATFSRSWTERRNAVCRAAIVLSQADPDVLRDIESLRYADACGEGHAQWQWPYVGPAVSAACVPFVYAATCVYLFVRHRQPVAEWADSLRVAAARMSHSMWVSLFMTCVMYVRSVYTSWSSITSGIDERQRDSQKFNRAVNALWRVLFMEDPRVLLAFDENALADNVRLAHFIDAIQGVARGFGGCAVPTVGSTFSTGGIAQGADIRHTCAIVDETNSIRDCLRLALAFGVSNCKDSCTVPASLSRIVVCDDMESFKGSENAIAILGDVFRDLTDAECDVVLQEIDSTGVQTIIRSTRHMHDAVKSRVIKCVA